MTDLPLVAAAGVLGLAVGSFLNVVVYRVPREESLVAPGSHCPSCDTPILARHNVPVAGWLWLRGRCASCRAPISPRYPMVEAGTAALFMAITLRFGLSVQLPAYLYLAAAGLALALIDFDVRRLPDSIVLPSYVVAVLLLMPAGAVDTDWWPAARAVVGMAVLWAVYFALGLAYPNGLGRDDVKLAGLLGLYLGWLSWSALLLGVLGGFLISGLSTAALVATGRVRQHHVVPLAPCMIAATGLAVFTAVPLGAWYGSLLAMT